MVKRSSGSRGLLWICGMFPVILLILTPCDILPGRIVSLAAFLPGVFLLLGWHDSRNRNGLLSLLFRTEGTGGIRLAEAAAPALLGTILSSSAALISGFPPPWQFWLSAPLAVTAFTLVFTVTEERMKYAGRAFLSLLWIWGISRPAGLNGTGEILVPTDYPGGVLFASVEAGGMHPDSYVVASLVFLLISAGIYSLNRKL